MAVKYAQSSGYLTGITVDGATLATLDLSGASWSGKMRQSCHIHHSNPGQKVVIFLKGIRYTRMWRVMEGELSRDRDPEKGGILILQQKQDQSNPCPSHLSEKFCQDFATLISGSYPRVAFNLSLHYAFQRDRIDN